MRALAVLLASCALLVAAPRSAAADDADVRKAAQQSFEAGTAAFRSGDFRRAAEAFHDAYARVPHFAALWNEARAWHQAGELVRAANLYAKYLGEAPAKAPDRDDAQAALKDLSRKLGRLEVRAVDARGVRLDGQVLENAVVYVLPGSHVVEGNYATGAVRVVSNVAAGEAISVALTAPPPPAPPPSSASRSASTSAQAPAAAEERRPPLPPWVVVVSGGATLAVGGVALWSGIDTLNRAHEYDAAQTQQRYDDGKAAEARTNVLYAATGVLAAATVVVALTLVDWKGASRARALTTAPLRF